MAQTKEQINAEVLAALQAQPILSGLTSTSQTSIWGQFKDAIVSVLATHQQLGDVQEARLNRIADEAVPGTPAWLQRQILKFQFGDQVHINSDLTVTYAQENAQKRIVSRCSIQENLDTREVLAKVAKGASTQTLTRLTADELSALRAYVERIKFAGIHVVALSLEADRVSPNLQVHYFGEYDPAVVKAAVIEAIQLFLQNLAFDGKLYVSKLVDTIQAVAGVQDVVVTSIVGRAHSNPLGSAQVVERVYASQAGYIVPEDTTGYTLTDTIEMLAA